MNETAVHYTPSTMPVQMPCGQYMPVSYTGICADVTCEKCKRTPLYKVQAAINSGRAPSESDRTFGE